MADNNDIVLETIKYIAEKTVEGLQFNKTVTCEIVSNLGNGKYQVQEGNTKYYAYSSEEYDKGDSVYVSIPNSDYNKQKFILGKVVDSTSTSYTYIDPLSHYFDLTGNLLDNTGILSLKANDILQAKETSGESDFPTTWIATSNGIEYNEFKFVDITIPEENRSSYTNLAINADFITFLSDATKGNYGLHFYVITTEDSINASGNYLPGYSLYLDTDDMTGDPYNFMTWFKQSKLFEIDSSDTIKRIVGYYYQKRNFYMADGTEYPLTYKGNAIFGDISSITGVDNILINNITLSLGYANIDEEKLILHCPNERKYDYRNETNNNTKALNLRWNHIINSTTKEAVAITTALDAKKYITNRTIIPHWYLYQLDAKDDLAGADWIEITVNDSMFTFSDDKFSCTFNPRSTVPNEYVKAILEIVDEDGLSSYQETYKTTLKDYASQMDDIKQSIEDKTDEATNLENIDQATGDKAHESEINTLLAEIETLKDDATNLQLKIDRYKLTTSNYYTYLYSKVSLNNSWVNHITFTNSDETSQAEVSKILIDSLKMTCTNDGKYNIYDTLTNRAINTPSIQTATLQMNCKYLKLNSKNGDIQKVVWYIPKTYTMIYPPDESVGYNLANGDLFNENIKGEPGYDATHDGYYIITRVSPTLTELSSETYTEKVYTTSQDFRIRTDFRQTFINNNIICTVWREGHDYSAELPLSFGLKCTNGTDNTLTIYPHELYNLTGSTKTLIEEKPVALMTSSTANRLSFTADFFDSNDDIITSGVEYSWSVLYNTSEYSIDSNGILTFNNPARGCIVKCIATTTDNVSGAYTKGYVAYFPVAVRNNHDLVLTNGAIRVCYNSAGSSARYNEDSYDLNYEVCKKVEIYTGVNTQITESNYNKTYFDLPYIKNKGLVARTMYFTDTENTDYNHNYDVWVKVYDENDNYWIQPILVLQDQWESQLLNGWDGSFQVDEDKGTVLGTMIGAGKKESNGASGNAFTGVLMGDVANGAGLTSTGIGLYGYQKGAQSFGFKVDGTAFIGQSGKAQLKFDGTTGTIQNSSFKDGSGMLIDFDGGYSSVSSGSYIHMKNGAPGMKVVQVYEGNVSDYPYSSTATYYNDKDCTVVKKALVTQANISQALTDYKTLYGLGYLQNTSTTQDANLSYYFDSEGTNPVVEDLTQEDFNKEPSKYYYSKTGTIDHYEDGIDYYIDSTLFTKTPNSTEVLNGSYYELGFNLSYDDFDANEVYYTKDKDIAQGTIVEENFDTANGYYIIQGTLATKAEDYIAGKTYYSDINCINEITSELTADTIISGKTYYYAGIISAVNQPFVADAKYFTDNTGTIEATGRITWESFSKDTNYYHFVTQKVLTQCDDNNLYYTLGTNDWYDSTGTQVTKPTTYLYYVNNRDKYYYYKDTPVPTLIDNNQFYDANGNLIKTGTGSVNEATANEQWYIDENCTIEAVGRVTLSNFDELKNTLWVAGGVAITNLTKDNYYNHNPYYDDKDLLISATGHLNDTDYANSYVGKCYIWNSVIEKAYNSEHTYYSDSACTELAQGNICANNYSVGTYYINDAYFVPTSYTTDMIYYLNNGTLYVKIGPVTANNFSQMGTLYATYGTTESTFNSSHIYYLDKSLKIKATSSWNVNKCLTYYYKKEITITNSSEYINGIKYYSDINHTALVYSIINSENFIANLPMYVKIGELRTETTYNSSYDYYSDIYCTQSVTLTKDSYEANKYYTSNNSRSEVKIATTSPYFKVTSVEGEKLIEVTDNKSTIAGWTIDQNSFYTGTNLSSTDSGAVALSASDFTRTVLGESRSGLRIGVSNKFAVDKDGNLYANGAYLTDANVTGTIHATTIKADNGEIDDCDIDNCSINNCAIDGTCTVDGGLTLNGTNLQFTSIAMVSDITQLGIKVKHWHIFYDEDCFTNESITDKYGKSHSVWGRGSGTAWSLPTGMYYWVNFNTKQIRVLGAGSSATSHESTWTSWGG